METGQGQNADAGTNCLDCDRYKALGEVCVIEHGKKFLWEFCKDFQPQVQLPEYDELMRSVRKDMALERKKQREKKEREKALKEKELRLKKDSRSSKAGKHSKAQTGTMKNAARKNQRGKSAAKGTDLASAKTLQTVELGAPRPKRQGRETRTLTVLRKAARTSSSEPDVVDVASSEKPTAPVRPRNAGKASRRKTKPGVVEDTESPR